MTMYKGVGMKRIIPISMIVIILFALSLGLIAATGSTIDEVIGTADTEQSDQLSPAARIEYYSSRADRRIALDAATAVGETMIHDDFIDINGNDTDGTSGRLTFDVLVSEPLTVNEVEVNLLKGRAKGGAMSLVELIRYFELKGEFN